jgi:hypothetical protein
VVAAALISQCIYVIVSVAIGLDMGERPDASLDGLAVAAAAVIGMPHLARRKRQLAGRLASAALHGDAACAMTCAITCAITCAAMEATLVVGPALNALFGWRWAGAWRRLHSSAGSIPQPVRRRRERALTKLRVDVRTTTAMTSAGEARGFLTTNGR